MSIDHSPIPWIDNLDNGGEILSPEGHKILHVTYKRDVPFVLAAVNNFDALLEACRMVEKRGCLCHSTEEKDWHGSMCPIPKIRAVIREAEEKP
jgi:hypothetical protein